MKKKDIFDVLKGRWNLLSRRPESELALEKRRDLGVLEVAREHAISEKVSGGDIRPTDAMVGETVDGKTFKELLDNNSAEDLAELKRQKKKEFGEIIDSIELEEPVEDRQEENLRIAISEYRDDAEIPPSVNQIVEGENGLRQKWGEVESFSEVEEEFTEMIQAFRDYSDQDYGRLLEIWEPNIEPEEIDEIIEEVRDEAVRILEGLEIEEVQRTWADVEDGIRTDKNLKDLTSNPAGMHEFLANYILGGNPVKMPVRIGGSGMEYGNAVMAPLQTIDDKFWAKCFDTTAHEFGHTYGRENLSSEHAFLPLGEPPSEAVDEGTARFYQNQIFRSEEFLTEFFGPMMHDWLGKNSKEDPEFNSDKLYHWFNAIDPENRERISADPVTYPLHVAIRYELEKELIEGDKPVEKVVGSLHEKWQRKMQEYIGDPLGVEIEDMDDSETVLQDVHWGKGKLGYFPTYTLGDVMAANWRKSMETELEQDFETYLRTVDLEPINEWLADSIWRYGKSFWSKSDQTSLDVQAYLEQMRSAADIYRQV